MKIALFQMKMESDMAGNLKKCLSALQDAAQNGADLILIPTANTKAEQLSMFEWEIRVQAFQNCIPIVMCNRTGSEGQMTFAGESLAVDADGNLAVKANDMEQLVYVDIDIDNNRRKGDSRPYVSLRRPELYF